MTTAIEAASLTKTYEVGFFRKRLVKALQAADLTVNEGQVFGLLGPNGAGKSTLIKLILNLIHPTAGKLTIFGRPPSDAGARQTIGYLPENPAPYEYLTGLEFIAYMGRLAGLSGRDLKKNVAEVIEVTGMSAAASLQIRRYSKGMTQRICLAQALVAKPKLLVLDEPTSGLDVLGRQLVRDIILQQRALGTTIVMCSHIIPDVEVLCDHVAVIVGGQILQKGSVTSLLSTDTTEVEIQVEGLESSLATTLTPTYRKQGERWVLQCTESDSARVLRALIDASARVVSVQRSRYSLEDLFLKAVKASGQQVGSQIL